jgi:hypothetical protein
MNKRQLSKKYDELYAEAVALFREYNPCQFDHVSGTCLPVRDNKAFSEWREPFILCCAHCHYERRNRHSKKSGCRVKSLGCKLYTCYALEKYPQYKGFFIKRADLIYKISHTLPKHPSVFVNKHCYMKGLIIKIRGGI